MVSPELSPLMQFPLDFLVKSSDNQETSCPADPPQGFSRVILFLGPFMPVEPAVKRTVAFVEGQNLFHNARNVFGYTYPNYDVQKLSEAVCVSRGWTLERVQFYTGVPSLVDDAFWNGFWTN